MSNVYTGIGSRATPEDIQGSMRRIASELGRRGWMLRSGGAFGADTAFEDGCGNYRKRIYLPWKGFNCNSSKWYLPDDYMMYGSGFGKVLQHAQQLAALVHPRWDYLADTSRRLHIRNVFQVLGDKLSEQSAFVICWTPNGALAGGSATAMKLAMRLNIPVFNLATMTEDAVMDEINELIVGTDD